MSAGLPSPPAGLSGPLARARRWLRLLGNRSDWLEWPVVRLLVWWLGYLVLLVPGMAFMYRTAMPIGLAVGLAMALLVVDGLLFWPVIALGSFVAHAFLAGVPIQGAAIIACADTLEAVAGAALLRRLGMTGEVVSVRCALSLIAVSLGAPLLAAGGTVVAAGFHVGTGLVRWLADGVGILLMTPPLLAWHDRQRRLVEAARPREFFLVLCGTALLVSICYWYGDAWQGLGVHFLPPMAFVFPPLVWAVLRLSPREAVTALAFAGCLALAHTALLTPDSSLGGLLWLQLVLFGVGGGCLLFIGASAERLRAQHSLRKNEARFRTVFDHASVGMALTASDGSVLVANRRLGEILGYPREALLGKRLAEIGAPGFVNGESRLFSELVAGRKDHDVVEARYRRKDGMPIWVRVSSSLVQGMGEARCIAVFEDISTSRRAEAALRQSEERLRYVTEAAEVGYWDWDLTTDKLEWSDRCKSMFGLPVDEPVTYPRFLATVNPGERDQVAAAVQKALDGAGDYDIELRVVWPCGSDRWVHTKGRVAFDAEGRPVRMAGVALDITARKTMEDAVRRLSQHDALTGLPNRALIYEYAAHLVAEARRNAKRVAFLFVDLDRFKPINDNYGHDVGDAVLKEVAHRLSDCVRGQDFVGRLGGDEFVVVVSNIHHSDNAAKVALHALVRLDMPLHVESLSLQVTPSIGISLFPDDGISVDMLIKNADTAMYHAKECGRDNFQFFRPELNARVERALSIEARLRRAMELGEFQLYFQPVVDLASGRPRAAEALLRWPNMDAEPRTFIAVAEAAGLMQLLGSWVLREACRHQRRWLDKGLPFLPVAVNVSAAQLRDKEFAAHVAAAVRDAGLEGPALRLELTESTVMGQADAANEALPALHDMGIKVAVDNFGVGLSSMDRLSHLPLDILKLDKTFVSAIGRDSRTVAVIDAVLALAHSLNLEVVAEGVETEDELNFLKQRRCSLGQGYLFSKPLPARQFEDWYRQAAA